jgi:hypothetical protein
MGMAKGLLGLVSDWGKRDVSVFVVAVMGLAAALGDRELVVAEVAWG